MLRVAQIHKIFQEQNGDCQSGLRTTPNAAKIRSNSADGTARRFADTDSTKKASSHGTLTSLGNSQYKTLKTIIKSDI